MKHYDHETFRRKLWKDVAVAVAAAENTFDKTHPAEWADEVLADFDARFEKPKSSSPLSRFGLADIDED